MQSGSPGDRLFVGRERELEELRAGLRDAVGGRGGVFLIAGEGGIGKTRLVAELQGEAERVGARVCWARCWEGGGAPAFWPWTVLVRTVAEGVDDGRLAILVEGDGAQLVTLAPGLRQRLPALPPLPAPPAHDSEHTRFPLFDAVAGFLRRAAAATPLMLVLDDLHAADHASLLLLAFLVRHLQGARLLVVGTYRDAEAHRDAERGGLLTRIGRAGARLPLAGWDAAETAAYVRAGAAGGVPDPALVAQLQQLTEGNPFFIDEIVRLLLADGGGRLPAALVGPLPGSLRATVRERLRPLSPPCLRVLDAAAVIGREFDLAVLSGALGADSTAVVAALGAAEALGVVRRRDPILPRFTFAHALIRETLYEALPAGERAAWHRAVGTALERLHAADLTPHLDEIAHHFAHAAPDGGIDKAIAYDRRAAAHAAALLAYEDAVPHLERALRTQALCPAADATAELGLRLQLGEMQAAAWRLDAARATLRGAGALARRLGRASDAARAALGVASLGFGLPRGVVDAEIVTLLEAALCDLAADDPLWPRVAVRLAVELHFSAAGERREALSQAAVDAARRGGDAATLAYVVNARHFAVWDSAEVEERLLLADEGVRLAERIGDADLALQARTWRLLDLWEIGDVTGFDREFEPFARRAEARRQPKFLAFVLSLRGLRALWAGRFEAAVAHAAEAVALGERVGDRAAFASVGMQVFVARRAQGRIAEVEPIVRAMTEQPSSVPATRVLLAIACADLGRADDARREYEVLAGDDFVALQQRNGLHPLVAYLTELAVFLGDTRRAAVLYRAGLPFAGRNLGFGPTVVFGPVSHALGSLAALLGEWAAAERHFTHAIEEATRAQGPAWLAAVHLDYALGLQARGELARARAHATAARDGSAPIGLRRIEALATALLAASPTRASPAALAWAAEGGGGGGTDAGRDNPPGRLLQFPVRAGARSLINAPRAGGAQAGQFRCEGEYWSIGIGADVVRLRGTSGVRYLAELLRRPGAELHALALAAAEQAPPEPPGQRYARAAVAQAGFAGEEASEAHVLLDAQARAAYRRQVEDLREQLEEARAFNDPARVAGLERELEFLARELARAVGLHGTPRPGSTRAERARLNVTRAIRSAIKRMTAANRHLGLYFETTVKTGAYCSYTSDPRLPVTWTF